jgi:ABC-type lipoprotein release transport system permease subunit
MSFLKFLFAEIKYRKIGYLANAFVVTLAVVAVVFISLTSQASKRSIRLITKSMGQNIIVMPEDASLENYYTALGRPITMPQAYVDTLAAIKEVQTTYHVAILQTREKIEGKEAILTGARPIKGVRESDDKKNPFIEIKKGTIRLGSEIAKKTGLSQGSTASIAGRSYTVERIEEEQGTMDDLRVYLELEDIQEITGQQGRINAILSLECLCAGVPLSVIEERIRKAIRRILPDVKVITLRNIAIARYEAREVTERYNRIVLVLLFVATLLFIVVQSYTEAAKRERESALMSAVGFPHLITLLIYVIKAILIIVPAVVAGYLAGQYLSVKVGPLFAKARVSTDYSLMGHFFIGAFVIVVAGFVPAIVRSMRSDPFEILREE